MAWNTPLQSPQKIVAGLLRTAGPVLIVIVLGVCRPSAAQHLSPSPGVGETADLSRYEPADEYAPYPSASLPDELTAGPPYSPSYYLDDAPRSSTNLAMAEDSWTLQVMPDGLIYHSYMAGVKEPRVASVWSKRRAYQSGWDVALGGRIGLLRYGTTEGDRPDGWQVDFAGGVFARLDPAGDSTPLIATDYRGEIPITYGCGPLHLKLAYYHISSHLGDEYMLGVENFKRINYRRDGLAFGAGFYWTDALRAYGEVGCAAESGGGAEPWEFQVGLDYSPLHTGLRGSPFWAVNAHSREEVDFGGNFVAQAGWQWRRTGRGGMFRTGLQYYTGKNEQYEFYDQSESRLGYGLWVDY